MKKNLRNILTLALGFVTVFATAQSWDADSRTRVNMSGENDQFTTSQRTSLGVDWGGDNWGISVNGWANVDHLGSGNAMMYWGETYAKANLWDFATVSIGNHAMNWGSGAIVGSNDWAQLPYLRAGGIFAIDNDMMDLDVAYYRNNSGGVDEDDASWHLINAAKADGDWSINLLYAGNSDDVTAMGLDLGYSMNDFDLAISYNTASDGDDATEDMDMTSIGGTYNVSDNISVSATRTTVGEGGFGAYGNYGASDGSSWETHGNMGYLNANDEDMAIGLSYSSGDWSLGVAMHTVSNEDVADDRKVTEMNFGYSMGDNASIGIKYATDDARADGDDVMYLTLSVTP